MPNDPMSQATALRRAGAADAEVVRSVTRAAYAKWVPLIGREPLPMRADYEVAVRDHRVDLLEVDGKTVALIETVREPDHLLVENVAVLPSWQGHGVGRRLMAHAETLALADGADEMRLYTNRAFAGNVALYLRLGYRIDREEAIQGGAAVYMSKRLG